MTTSLPLASRIRAALAGYGQRTAVEDASGQWRLTGAQLLGAAAALFDELAPWADRPIVAYLGKSPACYAFTACAFLYGLDYCPLDPDNPIQRVLDVAAQLPHALILCDRDDVLAQLQRRGVACRKLSSALDPATGWEQTARQHASYYIATSGSTGPPKLVQVPHERTAPFVDWAVPFYGIDAGTRWAQFSSVGFDLSLVDFLSVVCGGGTLVSLSAPIDRIRPAKTVLRSAITHWHSVPSMIPYFLRDTPEEPGAAACRVFTFCGEPLLKVDARALARRYPGARIVNTYGPTEGTLFCSFYEYDGCDTATAESSLPIGQPIPGWNFVLLPDADGVRLVILSDNVASGYVGQGSARFATLELFGRPMRAFDSGDYVHQVGGQLYFSHRTDTMVKVHGNRIDLGEIEAAAKRSGLVNPVAFLADGAIGLAVEGAPESTAETLSRLAAHLPRPSLPATVSFLPSQPRTVNGKLDRRAIQRACRSPGERDAG